MTDELELKLQECKAALNFYYRRLITSQSLRQILLDLYSYLEDIEAEKKPSSPKKKGEEIKEKSA